MAQAATVLLEPDEVRSMNEQIARLAPGEPYLTVIVDGKAIVRSARGVSQTLLQLWRKEPAMMVPDSLGYQPATRTVDLSGDGIEIVHFQQAWGDDLDRPKAWPRD